MSACVVRSATIILFSSTRFLHWKRNAEAREELYEQARAALIADFNRLDPPLSELAVLEERFKLNLAIHDFEFSAATGLN
jgi:hypothetical protein